MKKILPILVLALMTIPVTTFAIDTTYVPLSPLPCIESAGVICGGTGKSMETVDIKQYVLYTFNLIIALAGVAAVFMIVWGGFLYMTSDAVSGKEEGKDKLYNAVKGLLLVLCSFLILRTINPQFVQIPETLVEPLPEIKGNLAADWAGQIQAALDKQLADSLLTSQDQKLKIADLTQQLAIAEASGDATSYAIIQDELTQAKANLIANNEQTYQLQAISQQGLASSSISDINAIQSKLNQQASTTISGLQNSGAYTQAQIVKTNTLYTNGMLTVAKYNQAVVDAAAANTPGVVQAQWDQEKTGIYNSISQLPEPQKSQLQNQVTTLEQRLKSTSK